MCKRWKTSISIKRGKTCNLQKGGKNVAGSMFAGKPGKRRQTRNQRIAKENMY